MHPQSARCVALAVGVMLNLPVVWAQARLREPPAPVAVDLGDAMLALDLVSEPESQHCITQASFSSPASLSLAGVAAALSSAIPQVANDTAAPAAAPHPTPKADDTALAGNEDKSGTDPTKLLASFGFRNEYRRLTDDSSYNVTTFQYGSPLGRPDMSLRLRVPIVATDVLGDGDVGVGDVALRYNWRAYLDKKQGLLVGAELAADTASEDVLGRGKWTIAPSLTYAMFLSKNVIFAPAFQQTVSFAGDGNRADINESAIDLYMVFRADDAKSWLVVDPTLGIDWENEQNTPLTLEVEYGRNIGTLLGGALNAFIRPGVGIGQDRPYDWNFEFGFTVVGF